MLRGIGRKIDRILLKRKCKKNNIELGRGVEISNKSVLRSKSLSIGDYTRFNGLICIRGGQSVVIGKYCAFGWDIKIISNNHLMCYPNIQMSLNRRNDFIPLVENDKPIVIGNNVWIGDNVIVLSGVEIGDGAVIGAGSVVTKDIPPFHIAGGCPARIIRKRFPDGIIDQLEDLKWWDWSEEKIKINKKFFQTDLTDGEIRLDEIIKNP